MLKLMWKSWGDGRAGGAFWAGYIWREGKRQWTRGILHISIYRRTVSFMLKPYYSMWNSFLCLLFGPQLSWLWKWQPLLSADRAVVIHCLAIYCTKLPQLIWCQVQISINIVTFHLYYVCACGGVHMFSCVLKWNKDVVFSYGSLQMFYIFYKL